MGARFASYQCFILDLSIMKWTKSENELKNFMKDLNSKHPSIKLDFKHFKDKIKLLDALLYIDQHEKLQTTQQTMQHYTKTNRLSKLLTLQITPNTATLGKKHFL